MAVYAFCEKCQQRRETCEQQSTHKRFVAWVADWNSSRVGPRLRKVFGSDLTNPKELADIQIRQWKTDRERGVLKLKSGVAVAISFETVADEWWTKVVIGQNRIKDPNRTERSRVNKWKTLLGSKAVGKVTLEDFEEWVSERRENDIAINTINRDLKPVRWILDYAVEKGYIEKNPMDSLKGLKGGNIHDRWMTEEEVGKLLQAAIDLGDMELADFMAVGVNTGFRLGNLERLTARDIDGDLLMAVQTKSGTPYGIPISPDIEPILRRLVRQNPTGPLLIGRDNNVGERFRAAARKAGLYTSKDDTDRVTIHTLRHTFAVLYLKRGGDIYKLSKLLGHASVAITDKIYARFCPKEKLKEAPLISTPVPQLQAPALKII